jgi:two-component system response regulator (stage 0 sporulation protein F)
MRHRKTKLLVVDDTEAVRKSIAYYFKEKGFAVFTAASGEESLPIIIGQRPEIMLADITLPQMNGIELVKLVRQFNKTIKVIFISAEIENFKNNPQLKQLDIFAFLDKPPDFFELESLVKKALMQVEK